MNSEREPVVRNETAIIASVTSSEGQAQSAEATAKHEPEERLVCTAFNCRDPECDRLHLQECQGCSAEVEELFRVADCDLSVGYHGEIELCEECLQRRKNRCGMHL